jgi:Putative integral membrane protein DUF46.
VEILNKLEHGLDRVHIWLRNFISDETLLGIVAYLMGIKEVPWVVASRYFHHDSAPGKVNEALVASAHRQLAKGLGSPRSKYIGKYLRASLRNTSERIYLWVLMLY